METTGKQEMRIAVKCKQCNMTIFYKTTPSTGIIECKCPRCRKITEGYLLHLHSAHAEHQHKNYSEKAENRFQHP